MGARKETHQNGGKWHEPRRLQNRLKGERRTLAFRHALLHEQGNRLCLGMCTAVGYNWYYRQFGETANLQAKQSQLELNDDEDGGVVGADNAP